MSFAGVLRGEPGTKLHAFTVFPRCNCTYAVRKIQPVHTTGNGSCPDQYVTVARKSPRGWTAATNMHACLFTPARDFNWMGLSVRSVEWRYTLWVEWDGPHLRPLWDRVVGEELYDHRGDNGIGEDVFDAWENENVVRSPSVEAKVAVKELQAALRAEFS